MITDIFLMHSKYAYVSTGGLKKTGAIDEQRSEPQENMTNDNINNIRYTIYRQIAASRELPRAIYDDRMQNAVQSEASKSNCLHVRKSVLSRTEFSIAVYCARR